MKRRKNSGISKEISVLDAVKDQIEEAYKILETCYENGGKLRSQETAEVPQILTISSVS